MSNILSWKSSIDVIVWDVDGTLYKSDPEMWDLMNLEIRRGVSEKVKIPFASFAIAYDQVYAKLGSHTQTLDHFDVDGRKMIHDVIQKKLPSLLSVDRKLKTMFERLKKYRHIVLSNAGEKMTKKKLDVLGVGKGVFERIFSTYEMDWVKPDRRVFDHVVNELGVDASRCLMVGDRVETDLAPAKAIGMRTCMVWGESSEVDLSVNTVYELGEMLGGKR